MLTIVLAAFLMSGDCSAAKTSLNNFLAELPKSCRTDSDCTGRYYGADSCAAPVVFNKSPLSSAKEKRLLTLQSEVRSACSTQQPGPACSPIPFRAQCVKNSCTDAMSANNQPIVAATPESPAYSFGTVYRSCAPWDGAALAFDLRKSSNAGENAPHLVISIYQNIPHGVAATPLTFTIDSHVNMSNAASRCPKPGGCWPASKGTVTLTKFEEGKGASGSYEVYFDDGTIERGKFNIRWKEFREMCG